MRHNVAQCSTICGKIQHITTPEKHVAHYQEACSCLWKTGTRNFPQVLRGVEVEDIGCGEQKVRFPQEQTRFQDQGRRANISSKSIERWSIVLKVGKGGGGGVGGGICGWMLKAVVGGAGSGWCWLFFQGGERMERMAKY